jgi:hypothetical protein
VVALVNPLKDLLQSLQFEIVVETIHVRVPDQHTIPIPKQDIKHLACILAVHKAELRQDLPVAARLN